MIYYTYQVFKDTVLDDYLKKLECYMNTELIECYGLSLKERKIWNIPFSERIDNDTLWYNILDNMSDSDLKKIELNYAIFNN